jgi:hypothetical protein
VIESGGSVITAAVLILAKHFTQTGVFIVLY